MRSKEMKRIHVHVHVHVLLMEIHSFILRIVYMLLHYVLTNA